MATRDDLKRALFRIDGKGYRAYKDIQGTYDFLLFELYIDHVQGDPFATPSRLRARVPMQKAGFMPDLRADKTERTALADFIARCFHRAIRACARGRRGTGKSGIISIDRGGQEILERNSVIITDAYVEARFFAGLPAAGRSVLGKDAVAMLLDEVPRIVERALCCKNLSFGDMKTHIRAAVEQEFLRGELAGRGLVAFVADGALLPRRSGIDNRPMEPGQQPVPMAAPPELRVQMPLPEGGSVQGMGIPRGVTLIAGGGFHGKSTLLRALECGVYNHVPGDGRERVVTNAAALKIRAEDGRFVQKVNISPFINNLPMRRDTAAFSTDNASGSTSQAAGIIEGIEMGAEVFLIDEDTSATNFMIRDERMQELVVKRKEPITPFIDKVAKLYGDFGISTVLVMGGSGDYFDVADTVVMMDSYRPVHVTDAAREIAGRHAVKRKDEGGESFGEITRRTATAECFSPGRGRRGLKIDARGVQAVVLGREVIDVSLLEQLVDAGQTRSIGYGIQYMASRCLSAGSGPDLRGAVERVMQAVEAEGLDILMPHVAGNLALPRRFEVMAAVNRMRSLEIT